MNIDEIIGILIAGANAILLLAAAHFFSLRLFGTLHRLICYAIGTALIGVIFGAWCAARGDWLTLAAYAAIVAGAGIGTGLGWLADKKSDRRERQAQEMDALRKEIKLLENRLLGMNHDESLSR